MEKMTIILLAITKRKVLKKIAYNYLKYIVKSIYRSLNGQKITFLVY